MATKIYENVSELNIDIPLIDSEGEQVPIGVISVQKFYALRPESTIEEEWEATVIEPNILRHTVPESASLQAGKYKLQPYIETVDGYKGRCETVEFRITANMK